VEVKGGTGGSRVGNQVEKKKRMGKGEGGWRKRRRSFNGPELHGWEKLSEPKEMHLSTVSSMTLNSYFRGH